MMRFIPEYTEPMFAETIPATKEMKTMLPASDALRRGRARWLKW